MVNVAHNDVLRRNGMLIAEIYRKYQMIIGERAAFSRH